MLLVVLLVLSQSLDAAPGSAAARRVVPSIDAPPPIPLPPDTLTWSGDFATGDLSQWAGGVARQGGPGWVTVVSSPFAEGSSFANLVSSPFADGSYVAKFVAPPYADGLTRVEVDEGGDAASGAGAIIYGSHTIIDFWLMVDRSTQFGSAYYVRGFGGRLDMAQWHPFYDPCYGGGVHVDDNGILSIRFRGGAMLNDVGGCTYSSDRMWRLGPVHKGQWLHFLADVVWSGDPSVGRVQVWLNGHQIVPRTFMATASSEGGGRNLRLRQGLYRTAAFNGTTVVYAAGMKLYKP